MTERDPLPFPAPDHDDAEIAERIARDVPRDPRARPGAGRAVRARGARRRDASHDPQPRGIPTTRWWWGAAAAAAVILVTARPWRGPASTREADSAVSQAVTSAALPGTITTLNDRAVRFDLNLPTSAQ